MHSLGQLVEKLCDYKLSVITTFVQPLAFRCTVLYTMDIYDHISCSKMGLQPLFDHVSELFSSKREALQNTVKGRK